MLLPGLKPSSWPPIGWLMHRTWGGIVAGGLFVLPSLLILIALSWVYIAFGEMPLVAGLYGIKPAVTAIVVQAAHRIGSRALKTTAGYGDRGSLPFIAIFAVNVPFRRSWLVRLCGVCWR